MYTNINLNLDYKTYEFSIEFSEKGKGITLNNFLFQYNFNEVINGNGSIHFKIKEKDNFIRTNQIIIRIPQELNITNICLKKEDKILKKGIDYKEEINKPCENKQNNTYSCDTHVGLYEFNIPLENVDIYVNINGHLIPNGEFRFSIDPKISHSRAPNTVIILDMGHFELKFPIQIVGEYSKYEINNDENTILKIKPSEDYNKGILQGPFQSYISLNTYNKVLSDKENRFEAFVIGFLVAILIFIAELLIEFISFYI